MFRKIINFLDNHRLILALTMLIILTFIFLIVTAFIFLNYDFKPLNCTKNIDATTCYHDNTIILKNPEETKNTIFKEHQEELNTLTKTYNLPEFNSYTAYFYKEIANLDYTKNKRNETLSLFFTHYSNTYNLDNFYQTNSLFYEIFYPYKIG